MSADRKVPEIRFKGFSGEWYERGFSDIATRVSIHLQSACLPCVEYEDIVAGKGRFNKNIHQKKNFKAGLKFEVGDVVFGKLRPYLKNWFLADFKGIAVGDFWVLSAENVTNAFLFFLIQTNKFNVISNLSAGSKMPRSDWGLVSSSCFFIPRNISESNEIGNYFQKLDTLIDQHQNKHDKLCNIKKAMLEKMFPKQGETIPEIRFRGFSGEWEETKLFNEAIVTTGFPFDSTEFSSSGAFLVITNGNIQNDSAVVDGKTGNRIATDKISCLSQYILNVGDILITMDGTVGRTAKVIDTHQILAQRVCRLVAKNNNEFLYQSLNTGSFLEAMTTISHGGTIKHISLSEISNYIFLIPKNLEEQAKIGSYLKKLDDLIAQHQQQITKLNNIKQACLSKMFV